jgi:hypothetical protein
MQIDAKLDAILASQGEIRVTMARMEATLAHSVEHTADHEGRLRRMERWRYAVPTSLVLAGAGALGVFTRH